MATFNPADKKNSLVVLSNSDLTVTGTDTGGNNWVRSNLNRTGKRYCEFTCTTVANTIIGIADTSTMSFPGSNAQSFGLFNNGFGSINGTFPDWGGGAGTPYNTYASGDVLGMAVDLTAKKVWFRKNGGVWNGSALNDPVTGVGGQDVSAYAGSTHYVVASGNNGCVTTANFGATAFGAAVPSGFLAWNAESTTLASVPAMTAPVHGVTAGVFATCVISGLNIAMTAKGPADAATTTLPTYVSTSFATRTNLSISLAGSPGDLMVMAAFIQATGTPPTITPPAGWTQLFTPSMVSDGATGGRLYAWYRQRLESDTSPTFTHTSALSIGWMGAIKGASGVAPIDAQSFNSGTGLTSTGTSITTTKYDNEVAVWIAHDWLAGATRTPPTGWIEDLDQILYIAHKNLTAAGATGNVTMGSGGGFWQVALVAFTPASVTVNTTKTVSQTLTSPALNISAGNATIPGQTIRIDNHLDVMDIFHSSVTVNLGVSSTIASMPAMTASTSNVVVNTNSILSIDSPALTISTGGVFADAHFPAEADIFGEFITASVNSVGVSIPIVANVTSPFMLASTQNVVGSIKPIIAIASMPAMTALTQDVAVSGKANPLVAGDWGTALTQTVGVVGKANAVLASVPSMSAPAVGVTVKVGQTVNVTSPAMTISTANSTVTSPPAFNGWNHDRLDGPGSLDLSDRLLISPPSLVPTESFSTVSHGAGTWYAEVTIGGNPAGYVGLYNEANDAGTEIVLSTGDVRELPSGVITPTFAPIHSGDVIGIAYDGTDGQVWFRVNGGAWNNDPVQVPVA